MATRPIPFVKDKIKFLIMSPHAQAVCGHNGTLNSFATKVGLDRSAVRYLAGEKMRDELDADHERPIADKCKFAIDWPPWQTGTLAHFEEGYTGLHPLGGRLDEDGLNAQLASIELFANQASKGWALGVILNCQETPLDYVVVAVKRGRIAIRASAGRLTDPVQNHVVERGTASLTLQHVGKSSTPMWIVDAGDKPIGRLTEPDALCQATDLHPGEPIVVTFSAYVKDLQRIEPSDDAEDRTLQDRSYSWTRLDYPKLGAAKKAIMTLLAARSIGADGFVELCRETRVIIANSNDEKG